VAFLALSVALGVASLFPIYGEPVETRVIIDDTFHLSPNEVRRQGLGAFEGRENLTVTVWAEDEFAKNFTIITYNRLHFNTTAQNFSFTFPTGADYYETVFTVDGASSGTIHLVVSADTYKVLYPLSWLNTPAKLLFFSGLTAILLILFKPALTKQVGKKEISSVLLVISRVNRGRLLALLGASLAVWLMILVITPTPLGTFEDWYTDHARHSYVASLFLKDGLDVFRQPLGVLASHDCSTFMFVTWPEMPHIYPIGSIFLFLPFGVLLQGGVDALLIFKLEIALFLVFAHVCLYFFLSVFLKKNIHLFWKLVGAYIIYVPFVIYAADGMFDAVAFFFSLIAVTMFLVEKYDGFFLFMAVSIFLKYQAVIFLFPFILFGVVGLLQNKKFSSIVKNKKIQASLFLTCVSGFTAYLSIPYVMNARPELIMNGINVFSSNAQISWSLQTVAVLVTFTGTLMYATYMYKRNHLLTFTAFFMLLPSFLLPYFQSWYLPFLFVYVLVPQRRNELEATIIWLVFMIFVLCFGSISFNPLQILGHLQNLF
jgi:hypothetical protein